MRRAALPLAFAALALSACRPDAAPAEPAPPEPVVTPAPTAPAVGVARVADGTPLTLYKSPTCGCCAAWGEHMAAAGFAVETVDLQDVASVKRERGIPDSLASCHTAVVEGYAVEGHVPAEAVARLLRERPDAVGLAVPGMPIGSPGMEQGDVRQPYEVVLVGRDGSTSTFARY